MVTALAVEGTNVYAGGDFTTAGGTAANRVARWDGARWHTLGVGESNGCDGQVLALATAPSGRVYAGGLFNQAGGVNVNRIAQWDGTHWAPLGRGLVAGGRVDALAVAPNGDVYAGGLFSNIGEATVNNFARWDGTNWWDVGGGFTRDPFAAIIKVIVVVGDKVYAGGSFDRAGGLSAEGVAVWDGAAWSPVGGGISSATMSTSVSSLALDGVNLYVGGNFTKAGNVDATWLARWDGENWHTLGAGPNSTVNSVVLSRGQLFIGGNFNRVAELNTAGIARWLGGRWWPVGSGIGGNSPVVACMTAGENGLFAGGIFTAAGGKPSTSFARWDVAHDLPLVEVTSPARGANFTTSDTIQITVDAASPNGALTSVEFFSGTNSIGGVAVAPFTFAWSNPTAGTNILTAKVTDQTGAAQISEGVIVVVKAEARRPEITRQPASQNVSNGASVTLSVEAAGPGPLSYRWFKDGRDLNITASTLALSNLALVDSARYAVVVANAFGSVTSAPAVLSVLQPVNTLWVRPGFIQAHTAPVIGPGGTVYFGTDNYNLLAFGPNGAYQWRYETGDFVRSSPAIAADGTIYFGSHDRNVYALNPDGARVFQFRTGYPVYGSPGIGLDGTIYIGSADTNFYALYPDGSLKWSVVCATFIDTPATIAADGTIYASSGPNLYAFTPEGTNKWTFAKPGYELRGPIVGGDGTIYVASSDHHLYALSPDGVEKWAFEGAGPFASSAVIGPGGTIYIGNDGVFDPTKGTLRGRLYAIAPNGALEWEFITGDAIRSSPAVAADGTIYFGCYDTKFYALNPNGTEKWEVNVGTAIDSGPAIRFDGVVYFATYAGDLYAVQGSSPLAESAWPMFQRDVRHTGNAGMPRISDGWLFPFASNAFDDQVNALAVSGRDLYVGGSFRVAGGVPANYIARWDGERWSGLGEGLNGPVLAVAVLGTNVYAGGRFTRAGVADANYIARWDGAEWHAFGAGANDSVNAFAVSGDTLYAGGGFTTIDGVPANYVARWDGAQWSAMGSGYTGNVLAMAMSGKDLYVGGFGTLTIGRWDGGQWSTFATANGAVRSLAAQGSNLYAGGEFTRINGVPVSSIAAWDGRSWSSLAGGITNRLTPYVFSLAVEGTNLYAGGFFTHAGGTNANNIAHWDGARWNPLGPGVSGDTLASSASVNALAVRDGSLYVGGAFLSGGGSRAIKHFGRWGGGGWSSVGPLVGNVDGKFAFTLSDQLGRSYGIEASTDLTNWVRVASYTNSGGTFQFVDPSPTNQNHQFYRAVVP